jgi:tetratricopeptide (TPR) repeat protein
MKIAEFGDVEMSAASFGRVQQGKLGRGEDFGERQGPTIKVKPWDPETPYLKILKKAAKADRYRVYLEQRVKFAESPAFYLDCADFFQRSSDPDTALQVLSNIVELELENPALYRVAAHRLSQTGELELARMLFEQVLKMRPEEPQSHRDLALVLDQLEDFEGASELLNGVVLRDWDRFEEIEVIALMELNRVLARAGRAGVSIPTVDARLIKLLDVDVRIILTWDTDMSDMDLWVTEPSGEQAYYGNNKTRIGGLVSRDFTDGYGPEEYILKKSMKGEYAMDVDYFGANGPSLIGPVTLQIEVFTNYGRIDEERQTLTVRLNENKDRFRIGKVSF